MKVQTKIRRKQNVAQGFWAGGVFRPIRASEDYDPERAGDHDDIFDREIRKMKNEVKAEQIERQQIENMLRRDAYGGDYDISTGKTLSQFVRGEGGFDTSNKYNSDADARLSWKAIRKKGLAHPKGKKSIDGMAEVAIEAGYYSDYDQAQNIVSDTEDDARGIHTRYAIYYKNNPKKKTMAKKKTKRKGTKLSVSNSEIDTAAGHLAKVLGTTKAKAKASLIKVIKNPFDGQMKFDFSAAENDAIVRSGLKEYLRDVSEIHKDFGSDQTIRFFLKVNNLPTVTPSKFRSIFKRLVAETPTIKYNPVTKITPIVLGYETVLKQNGLLDRVKGAAKRARARGKAKRALSAKLKAQAKLNRANAKLSAAEKAAVANPHPIMLLSTGLSTLVSAFTLKKLMDAENKEKKKTKQKENPGYIVSLKVKNTNTIIDKIIVSATTAAAATKKARTEFIENYWQGKQAGRKVANSLTFGVIPTRRNPKQKAASKAKINPKKIRSKGFETFQGESPSRISEYQKSHHSPKNLVQLGDLVELKLSDGTHFDLGRDKKSAFKLCADRGLRKLHIVGRKKFARKDNSCPKTKLNPIGEIEHIVYGTKKPHHGDNNYTHYIHKLGEDTGEQPLLCVDNEGYAVIHGGAYTIEARGIVN